MSQALRHNLLTRASKLLGDVDNRAPPPKRTLADVTSELQQKVHQ
jgi:hypothetical protein